MRTTLLDKVVFFMLGLFPACGLALLVYNALVVQPALAAGVWP